MLFTRSFTGIWRRASALAAVLLTLAAPPAAAEPVISTRGDAVIDWTARVVRVTGVGTPRVISPTGALTPDDLYATARADARDRVARALGEIPFEAGKTLREVEPLAAPRDAAARAYRSERTRHFSDGTVHLPVEADFSWVPAAWAPDPIDGVLTLGPPAPPGDDEPTGLVITLSGPAEPAIRVTLRGPDDVTTRLGLRGDPIGADGIIWVRDRADAPDAFVGPRPRLVEGNALGRGIIGVGEPDLDLFTTAIPGGVVIVTPADAAAQRPRGK